jgi:predicted alpha/beta-hydrolase family hydrolase
MTHITLRMVLACLLFTATSGAHAQDFEREARWRAEVVPGLVVGQAVDLAGPGHRPFLGLLTEPSGTDRASTTLLVIVHGIGVHPDHGIIGRLRMDLADEGYATLSIQMPVLESDARPERYEPLFSNAAERIAAAAIWARGKGYRDLVLVSHSLGSRMSNAYFDRTSAPAFRAWLALGLGAPYSAEFARKPGLRVFDVYGERDLEPVLTNAAARGQVAKSSGGRQQEVAGADHFYAGREADLVKLIAGFARAN